MVRFWEDKWCDDGILKDRFPRIYALEKCKKVSVRDKLADPSLEYSLRRNVRGGREQSQYDAISEVIGEVSLVPQADRYVWSLDNSGVYSVASMRKVIDEYRAPNVSSMTRWVKCMPIKVNIFAWKVKLDALPTRFNISRRGIDIGSLMCPICDKEAETSSHLFFNCCLASQICSKIARWWDVSYEDVNSYGDWLTWMVSLRLSAKIKLILERVFYAMW